MKCFTIAYDAVSLKARIITMTMTMMPMIS